jgi:hypothetical protein
MTRYLTLPLAWITVSVLTAACSDDFTPKASVDASLESSVQDAVADVPDAARDVAPVLLSAVRLALWSPDAPALDVCITPSGSPFSGSPMVANIANSFDGGDGCDGGVSGGLSYPEVTSYIDVPAGTYDVRLVAAGSSDCSTGLAPDLTGNSPLLYNTFNTLALIGKFTPGAGEPSLRSVVYPDDMTSPSAPDPTNPYVGVRFINAAPSVPSAEIGTYDTTTAGKPSYGAIASGVTFGLTPRPPTADRYGYLSAVPLPSTDEIAVRSSDDYLGTHQVVTTALTSVAGNTATTVVLVDTVPWADDAGSLGLGAGSSLVDAGSDGGAPTFVPVGSLVVCIDNAASICPLASCVVVP